LTQPRQCLCHRIGHRDMAHTRTAGLLLACHCQRGHHCQRAHHCRHHSQRHAHRQRCQRPPHLHGMLHVMARVSVDIPSATTREAGTAADTMATRTVCGRIGLAPHRTARMTTRRRHAIGARAVDTLRDMVLQRDTIATDAAAPHTQNAIVTQRRAYARSIRSIRLNSRAVTGRGYHTPAHTQHIATHHDAQYPYAELN